MLDPSGDVKAWIGMDCAYTTVLIHPPIGMDVYTASTFAYPNRSVFESYVMCVCVCVCV